MGLPGPPCALAVRIHSARLQSLHSFPSCHAILESLEHMGEMEAQGGGLLSNLLYKCLVPEINVLWPI